MAVEGEEAEYESDPEDALLPSAMRRREASDDEDGERSDAEERPTRRGGVQSELESDGEGAAPEYDDQEVDEEEEEEEEEVDEEVEVEEGAASAAAVAQQMEAGGGRAGGEAVGYDWGDDQVEEEEEEDRKKENAPYAVPTVGAFYMHDDRFRQSGRGRQRRMPPGRRLWASKDDHAWVHDRFEELDLQDAHYAEHRERRSTRGRYRGRGRARGRGAERGFVRGNRTRTHDESNIPNCPPKTVRGRGPRRYEPLAENIKGISATQSKQHVRRQESAPNTSTGRQPPHPGSIQANTSLPHKNVIASILNSASPPFYPSGSSGQDISVAHKTNTQTENINRTLTSSMHMEDKSSILQSGLQIRGKTVVDSAGYDKNLGNPQLNLSVSCYPQAITIQSSQSRVQTKVATINGPNNHMNSSLNQVAHVSQTIQPPTLQQRVPSVTGQRMAQITTVQMGQRSVTAIQPASPSEDPARNSSDVLEGEFLPGSSKSKASYDGKGKVSNHGIGRGSFLYGGAHILGANGALSLARGDQGFPATPALLPVMQFGGQHPRGSGVPAIGMALPGYVAQSQLSFGNPEMTWLPVLAGAAGALGASYGTPYIALDGSSYNRSSGQTSSSNTSREISTTKQADTLKSSQRPDIMNNESVQSQHKPRRYSEMNFGK